MHVLVGVDNKLLKGSFTALPELKRSRSKLSLHPRDARWTEYYNSVLVRRDVISKLSRV